MKTLVKSPVHRQVLLAISSAVLFAAPLASQAGSAAKREIGMDTCINAFVSEQLPAGHPLKIVKRDNTNRWTFPPNSKIEIKAKGRRTGESYGSATCVVNRKGELVAMDVHGERARYADGRTLKQEPRG